MTRRVPLLTFACLFIGASVQADDADDYRRSMSDIDSRLERAARALTEVAPEQSDDALDDLETAVDEVAEVVRLADGARGKNVSTDEKRKADYAYDAGREFPRSATALSQMKRIELGLKNTEYPRTCNDLNSKLRTFVDKVVGDKDHDGAQKIRDFAEQQARPVRESLNANQSQEGYMSSWRDTVTRFGYDRDRWRDVKAGLELAGKATFDGWKKLSEEARRECELVTRWEDNGIVRSAITTLGDKARSKTDLMSEVFRALDDASRALEGVERDSNESDILAAVRAIETIEDRLSRLKDVRGTDPKGLRMTEKWPEIAKNFKTACAVLIEMKQYQFHVDQAQRVCQEQERELLSRLRSMLDSDPFDQNRMALRRRAKAMASDAGDVITEKLAKGSNKEEEMRTAVDKARSFSAEDDEWKRPEVTLEASATAMFEYYKGAMREARRACAGVALGEDYPPIKDILSGDCSESDLDSLHDAQVEWCKNKGERSCRSLTRKEDCDEIRKRLAINEQCAARRVDIMTKCFRGGDAAHRRELADVERVKEVCMDRARDLCK